MSAKVKEIKLANPRGFCAGVDRAIDIVNRALEIYGSPVYVKSHRGLAATHVEADIIPKASSAMTISAPC